MCPRYYTDGSSRCPGCAGSDFENKHPSCPFITCCVKKKGFEVCGQCPDFPCKKFKSEKKYKKIEINSSYPPYLNVLSNLNFIKEKGVKEFFKNQKKRIKLLEQMLEEFNDGRSKGFYCNASVLLPEEQIKKALKEAKKEIKLKKIKVDDLKGKAKILKNIFIKIEDFKSS